MTSASIPLPSPPLPSNHTRTRPPVRSARRREENICSATERARKAAPRLLDVLQLFDEPLWQLTTIGGSAPGTHGTRGAQVPQAWWCG